MYVFFSLLVTSIRVLIKLDFAFLMLYFCGMIKVDGLWRCGHNSGYGSFCGCGTWQYKKDVRKHEKKCVFNPKNRNCFTCWHHGGSSPRDDACINGYFKSYAMKNYRTKYCVGWFYEREFDILSKEEQSAMIESRYEAIKNSIPKKFIPKSRLF